MADLLERIGQARERVEPAWTKERARRVRARLERNLLSRRRRRGVWVVATAAVVGLVAILFGQRLREPAATLPVQAEQLAAKPLLRFADGSEVFARSSNATLESVASTPEQVTLRLDTGSARFSVTPNARRTFQILAGAVSVKVIGTVFTVTRVGEQVAVAVERGRVRVSSPDGERELGAGQSGRFDSVQRAPAPTPPPTPPVAQLSPTAKAAPAWRALAQDGDYAAAFAELDREGPKSVRDLPEDLLLAADASRLGGRPDKAVPYLERLVRLYPRDARSALGAFTLGRTLLDQLGRPREAAQAFATARRLDGSGGLAEDALAREVESWSRAGDTALARERANEFVKRYPAGRRAAAVRRLGGLE